ncbi:hypothetical protein [Flavobacterium sp. HBTb2-11-1]|uniref:hypothetical protein n=1 Tax=Flavobacterium sp. HBTb2-11-1 TaxID=2692212 RepID=UPI001F43B478|nr:hypothetical protein [Flavobacterium sp. HBTb2-11-1]
MIFENENTEGTAAKAIEEETSKLPSDLFLYGSLAAMGTSLALKCLGKRHAALFVGQWASPFCCLESIISWLNNMGMMRKISPKGFNLN